MMRQCASSAAAMARSVARRARPSAPILSHSHSHALQHRSLHSPSALLGSPPTRLGNTPPSAALPSLAHGQMHSPERTPDAAARPSALGSAQPGDANQSRPAAPPPPSPTPSSAASPWASAASALAAASSLLSSLSRFAPNPATWSAALQSRTLGVLRASLLTNLRPRPPPPLPGSAAFMRALGEARVRLARDAAGRPTLCDGERDAIESRRAIVRTRMSHVLSGRFPSSPFAPMVDPSAASDESLPVLGLCLSGGGFRAMLSALGSLTSLQQQGVFDAASYVAGLSGGTWAMAQIYANAAHVEQHRKAQEEARRVWDEKHGCTAASSASDASSPLSSPAAKPSSSSPLFNPLLSSPVNLARITEECVRHRVTTNLFSGVGMPFVRECLVDKWGLHEEDALGLADTAATTSTTATTAGTSPSPSTASAASASQHSSPSSTSPLTLSSLASLLSSIGLSDAFGWCLQHKLLMPLPSSGSSGVAAADSSAAGAAAPALNPSLLPRLSDQAELLRQVSLPYPLYAAITRNAEQVECTPHEIGLPAAGAFIPCWALGMEFDKGETARASSAAGAPATATTPSSVGASGASASVPATAAASSSSRELPFSLLLGCFAAAYPTRVGRMLEEQIYTSRDKQSEPLLKLMHGLLHDTLKIGNESAIDPLWLPSFLRGLTEHPDPAVREHARNRIPASMLAAPRLSLMDAGLAYNLPFSSLLSPARGVDVIIALDASSPPEVLQADALRLAAAYAREHGLPFPDLRGGGIQTRVDGSVEEIERELEKVSFSSLDDRNTPADEKEHHHSPHDLLRSLSRTSNALVSVFPGNVARGVPTIVYLPLLANPRHAVSDEYRIRSSGTGGSSARAKAAATAAAAAEAASRGDMFAPPSFSSSSPASAVASSSPPLPLVGGGSSFSPCSLFDPRANFVSGGFCATLNFQYEPWQAQAVAGLSHTNGWEAQNTIRAVLRRVQKEKKKLIEAQERRAVEDKQ